MKTVKEKISKTKDQKEKDELVALKEKLDEHVPQPTMYGDYAVSTDKLLPIFLFVLSYAVLARDILKEIDVTIPSNNSTSGTVRVTVTSKRILVSFGEANQ